MEFDLEKHKIFIPTLGIDVIPYSIVMRAVEEIQKGQVMQFENLLLEIRESLNSIDITKLEDDKNLS